MLTVFTLSVTWKDIGLSVSIACPGNPEDRSIGVKEQHSRVLNNNVEHQLYTLRAHGYRLV